MRERTKTEGSLFFPFGHIEGEKMPTYRVIKKKSVVIAAKSREAAIKLSTLGYGEEKEIEGLDVEEQYEVVLENRYSCSLYVQAANCDQAQYEALVKMAKGFIVHGSSVKQISEFSEGNYEAIIENSYETMYHIFSKSEEEACAIALKKAQEEYKDVCFRDCWRIVSVGPINYSLTK